MFCAESGGRLVLGPKKVRISKGGARCGGWYEVRRLVLGAEGWCKVRSVVRGVKGGARCGGWREVRMVHCVMRGM